MRKNFRPRRVYFWLYLLAALCFGTAAASSAALAVGERATAAFWMFVVSTSFCSLCFLPVALGLATVLRGVLTLTETEVSGHAGRRLPIDRVLEARWRVAWFGPRLTLRTSSQTISIAFAYYTRPNQLQIIRYFRTFLPSRSHRDWYRFCRYALYIRRHVQHPPQRLSSGEMLAKWIGLIAQSILAAIWQRETDVADYAPTHAIADELVHDLELGLPREATSDLEIEECGFAIAGWTLTLAAVVALAVAPFCPFNIAVGMAGGAVFALLVAFYLFRRHARLEDEIAIENGATNNARWERDEHLAAQTHPQRPHIPRDEHARPTAL